MAILNNEKIKENILNLVRNSDIFTTTIRGVITATDTFTATASQTNFTLTNSGVKNIRSLKINDVSKILYKDYDINVMLNTSITSKLVTLVAGATINDEIKIEYDYSSTGDPIYPDFPDDNLTIKSYPRIYCMMLSQSYTPRSLADNLQQVNSLFEFGVIALNAEVDDYENQLYNLLYTNRKNLYYLNLLRVSSRSAKEPYKKVGGNLLFTKITTFTAPTQFER